MKINYSFVYQLKNLHKFEQLDEMNELREQSTINADMTLDTNCATQPSSGRRQKIRELKQKDANNKHAMRKQGEKIQTLKNQIERQMKDYVKQEEYEEVLKLLKKLNLLSDDKWEELEQEVDRLDYSDIENRSSRGFITEDEIAALATDLNNTPYYSKSINEVIELSRKNSELRQSTPFTKENERQQQQQRNKQAKHNFYFSDSNNTHANNEYELREMNKNNNNSTSAEHKINYGHKRSILRKLMIAQRQQFLFRKEQAELNKIKTNLADTSISNFSMASGHVTGGEKKLLMDSEQQQTDDHDENVK